MSELLSQLGIDFSLLISQGVNFFIVLAVLTFFVYRPLVKIMNERKARIDFGLKGADEAERKLLEVDVLKQEKIREGEKSAFEIIKSAENKAIARGDEIIKSAEDKAEDLLKKAKEVEDQKRMEAFSKLSEESKSLIRGALAKMVKLSPDNFDEALIKEAIQEIKAHKI